MEIEHDGQILRREDYPELYAAIGDAYAGPPVETFTLQDYRMLTMPIQDYQDCDSPGGCGGEAECECDA